MHTWFSDQYHDWIKPSVPEAGNPNQSSGISFRGRLGIAPHPLRWRFPYSSINLIAHSPENGKPLPRHAHHKRQLAWMRPKSPRPSNLPDHQRMENRFRRLTNAAWPIFRVAVNVNQGSVWRRRYKGRNFGSPVHSENAIYLHPDLNPRPIALAADFLRCAPDSDW